MLWLGRVDYEPTWRAMQARTDEATRRDARRDLVPRASARVHDGHERQGRAPAAPRRHPGRRHRSRRAGDLSRPGPAGRVPAARPLAPRRSACARSSKASSAPSSRRSRSGASRRAASAMRPASTSASARSRASGCASAAAARYHGLALNVAMDLEPFARINPCGYAGLQMTQVSALGGPADVRDGGRGARAAPAARAAASTTSRARQSATSTWLQDVSSHVERVELRLAAARTTVQVSDRYLPLLLGRSSMRSARAVAEVPRDDAEHQAAEFVRGAAHDLDRESRSGTRTACPRAAPAGRRPVRSVPSSSRSCVLHGGRPAIVVEVPLQARVHRAATPGPGVPEPIGTAVDRSDGQHAASGRCDPDLVARARVPSPRHVADLARQPAGREFQHRIARRAGQDRADCWEA